MVLAATTLCVLSTTRDALAKVPLEVAIGKPGDQVHFKPDGYGVLVRYKDECLVVTPAHVVTSDSDNVDIEEVTARLNNKSASISYIDADTDRDIYVGLVDPASPLFSFCDQTEDMTELNSEYLATLSNMIESNFHTLKLHQTPLSIDLVPASERTLNDAKRRRPIRYRLAPCTAVDANDCTFPKQGFSGSIISMPLPNGDDLWLGLHQLRCELVCGGSEETWQAITVMQIYEFMASPNSPLNANTPQLQAPDFTTPLPGYDETSSGFKSASYDFDVAFSKFLAGLAVMRFPQAADGACAHKCSIWELRKFYSSETKSGDPEGFKSTYEDLGPSGSTLVGSTVKFAVPFDRVAFLNVIAQGKQLNQVIDETQKPPPNLSLGDQLGFTVNGSPDAWIKFYERVPAQYESYVEAVHVLFDSYCKNFKPASEKEPASKGVIFFGDMASYEDPCLKGISWGQMIEKDPSFVISKLREGF